MEIVTNRALRVGQRKIRHIIQLNLPFIKLVLSLSVCLSVCFRQLQSVALPDWPVAQAGF